VLAAVGIAALIRSSDAAFNAVRYAGAAYLAWIGIQALRHRSSFSIEGTGNARALAAIYKQSVIGNILNPKVTLFFLAFLPQFVEQGASSPLAQLLLLSGVFMAMTFAVFIVYGLLAHTFRRAVIESPRVQSWLRRVFAVTFVGLGAQLALSER